MFRRRNSMGKWYSSQNMASKANLGLYSVGRGIGKTVYYLQHGTIKGVKGVGQLLTKLTRARRSNLWSSAAVEESDMFTLVPGPVTTDRRPSRLAQPDPLAPEYDSPQEIESDLFIHHINQLLASQNPGRRMRALRAVQRYLKARPCPNQEGHGSNPCSRDWAWATSEFCGLCYDDDAELRFAALEVLMLLNPVEGCAMIRMMMDTLDPFQRRRAMILLAQDKDVHGLDEADLKGDTLEKSRFEDSMAHW